jgi:hypothetical protein
LVGALLGSLATVACGLAYTNTTAPPKSLMDFDRPMQAEPESIRLECGRLENELVWHARGVPDETVLSLRGSLTKRAR